MYVRLRMILATTVCILFILPAFLLIAQSGNTPISKEASLELQLLDSREKEILKPLQEIADMLLAPIQEQRNAIIIRECAKIGADAAKGECTIDAKAGKVIDKRSAK
jgi:hypothetical protein